MKVREYLFRGFEPCSDGDCIVKKPEGMCTNGGCHCIFNLSRAQLHILTSRLQAVADKEIEL